MNYDYDHERASELADQIEKLTRRFDANTAVAVVACDEGNTEQVEMCLQDLERTYVLTREVFREQRDLALRKSQLDELAARRLRKSVDPEPFADPYGETADVPTMPWAHGEG